eukprot:362399-Chlamydomonas_euryale.AAC.2
MDLPLQQHGAKKVARARCVAWRHDVWHGGTMCGMAGTNGRSAGRHLCSSLPVLVVSKLPECFHLYIVLKNPRDVEMV